MYTRIGSVIMFMVGIICLPCFSGTTNEQDTASLTKEQVLQLIPQGIDFEDKKEIERYNKLVSMGERAYPGLVQLLEDTKDRVEPNNRLLISTILSVFINSRGDKRVPIEATKRLLAKTKGEEKAAVDIRIIAVMCLGKIGRPEDRECIFSLLEDRDEKVRINALRALSKLGNEGDVKRIQDFLGKRKAQLTDDEIGKDYSLKEAEKVIEELKQKKNRGASQQSTNETTGIGQ